MGPCIVNVFFQVYKQDATLYNILYYCQYSTCFRRFLRPSSGAQNCTHSIWYMSSLLAATASVGELELTWAWHIPGAVCTVLMGWETAWNMYSIDSNKEICITLHLVGYTWKNNLMTSLSIGERWRTWKSALQVQC
jgi:hypothetical protein